MYKSSCIRVGEVKRFMEHQVTAPYQGIIFHSVPSPELFSKKCSASHCYVSIFTGKDLATHQLFQVQQCGNTSGSLSTGNYHSWHCISDMLFCIIMFFHFSIGHHIIIIITQSLVACKTLLNLVWPNGYVGLFSA